MKIVISASVGRKKGKKEFARDIRASIQEIYRVLKFGRYFAFTYHSLSGFEWGTITNALIEAGFEITNCEMLRQKTLPPRQLNRAMTVKGDLLVICKKTQNLSIPEAEEKSQQEDKIKEMFAEVIETGAYETGDVIVGFLERFFSSRMIIKNPNVLLTLKKVANFDGKGWKLNEDIRRAEKNVRKQRISRN